MMSLTREGNSLALGRPLLLGSAHPDVFLGRGWSNREPDFCWTEGPFAEIELDIEEFKGVLCLDCCPLILGSRTSSQVLVFLNGVLACAESLKTRTEIMLDIPVAERVLNLLIWVPDVTAPVKLDPTLKDERQLGVQVYSISLKN